jgi:hypothetical protein
MIRKRNKKQPEKKAKKYDNHMMDIGNKHEMSVK